MAMMVTLKRLAKIHLSRMDIFNVMRMRKGKAMTVKSASRSPLFCAENQFADGSTRRRRGPPRRSPQDESSSIAMANRSTIDQQVVRTQSASSQQHLSHLVVRTTLSESITNNAFNKYWHSHIRQAHGLQSSVEGYIASFGMPTLNTASTSTARLALSAVMLIYFGLTQRSEQAVSSSSKLYEQALRSTNETIRQLTSVPSDELLLSVRACRSPPGRVDCRFPCD